MEPVTLMSTPRAPFIGRSAVMSRRISSTARACAPVSENGSAPKNGVISTAAQVLPFTVVRRARSSRSPSVRKYSSSNASRRRAAASAASSVGKWIFS